MHLPGYSRRWRAGSSCEADQRDSAAAFSNLDGLFAFHTSAEDAEYLAEELGWRLNKQDLLEMGHYQCYARLTECWEW